MELRHLRYFVAVADELSFTRGAEKLRIAQPSLTRQIRDLEEELGTRLLDRTKKKVTLTREGQFFLDRAKRLLGLSAEMVKSVHELDRTINHTVNIGYMPNPFHCVLPASLTAFEKAFPDVSINLFGMPSAEQINAVKDNKLDIGFIGLFDAVKDSELESLLVGSYKGVVLLPRGSSFAKGGSVRLKDLGRTFLVALSEKCYPGYRRWLDAACQRVGVQAKVVEVLESDTALIQAVRSGLGIALLPEQIRDVPHDNIVIRAVTPPVLFSSTIVWKKSNSAAGLKAYLEIVNSVRSGKPLVT
jgi:LysR family transcriptional regulator, hca operon transcriptional activator